MGVSIIAKGDNFTLAESTPCYRTVKFVENQPTDGMMPVNPYHRYLYIPQMVYFFYTPFDTPVFLASSLAGPLSKGHRPLTTALPNSYSAMCVYRRHCADGSVMKRAPGTAAAIQRFVDFNEALNFYWQSSFEWSFTVGSTVEYWSKHIGPHNLIEHLTGENVGTIVENTQKGGKPLTYYIGRGIDREMESQIRKYVPLVYDKIRGET